MPASLQDASVVNIGGSSGIGAATAGLAGVAGDPASPDAIVREPDIALLDKHSPKVEVRVISGANHLIHDSKQHRHAVLDAVRDLLGRL